MFCNHASSINQWPSSLAFVIRGVRDAIFDDHLFPTQPIGVLCHTFVLSIALKDFVCVAIVEVVGIFQKGVLLYDPLLWNILFIAPHMNDSIPINS